MGWDISSLTTVKNSCLAHNTSVVPAAKASTHAVRLGTGDHKRRAKGGVEAHRNCQYMLTESSSRLGPGHTTSPLPVAFPPDHQNRDNVILLACNCKHLWSQLSSVKEESYRERSSEVISIQLGFLQPQTNGKLSTDVTTEVRRSWKPGGCENFRRMDDNGIGRGKCKR